MRVEPDESTPPDQDRPSQENARPSSYVTGVEFVEEVDEVGSVEIIHDISWKVAFKIATAILAVSVVASAVAWLAISRAVSSPP